MFFFFFLEGDREGLSHSCWKPKNEKELLTTRFFFANCPLIKTLIRFENWYFQCYSALGEKICNSFSRFYFSHFKKNIYSLIFSFLFFFFFGGGVSCSFPTFSPISLYSFFLFFLSFLGFLFLTFLHFFIAIFFNFLLSFPFCFSFILFLVTFFFCLFLSTSLHFLFLFTTIVLFFLLLSLILFSFFFILLFNILFLTNYFLNNYLLCFPFIIYSFLFFQRILSFFLPFFLSFFLSFFLWTSDILLTFSFFL